VGEALRAFFSGDECATTAMVSTLGSDFPAAIR